MRDGRRWSMAARSKAISIRLRCLPSRNFCASVYIEILNMVGGRPGHILISGTGLCQDAGRECAARCGLRAGIREGWAFMADAAILSAGARNSGRRWTIFPNICAT